METSQSALAYLKSVLHGQLHFGDVNHALACVKQAAIRLSDQQEAQEAVHQIHLLVQEVANRLPPQEPELDPRPPRTTPRPPRTTPQRGEQWRQLLIQELAP